MGFNKKRACCCDEPPVSDDFYFEIKPKIPINSEELSQSGTYSYWFLARNVSSVGGVPVDSTVLYEHSASNYASEVGFDVTFLVWKALTDQLVFVPRRDDSFNSSIIIHNTDGAIYRPAGIGPVEADALRFRGFYMESNPRVLDPSDWDDLDEIRVVVELPLPISESAGQNKFRTYYRNGYFFGTDQFDDTPAIGPTTFGDLQWSLYPKTNANMPVVLNAERVDGGGTGTLEFFDFAALFPVSLSVGVSGDFGYLYKRSGINNTSNDPPDHSTVGISNTLSYSKAYVSVGGVNTIEYQPNWDPNDFFLGTKTESWEVELPPPFDPIEYNVELKFKPPFSDVNIGMGSFAGKPQTGAGIIPLTTVAGCVNDIGFNPEGNRLGCASCNPNSSQSTLIGACSPSNYGGSYLKDKQFALAWTDPITNHIENAQGIDAEDPANYPAGIEYDAYRIPSVTSGPYLVWGEATGSAVTLEIVAPNLPGLPSWREGGGTGTCHQYPGSPSEFADYKDIPVLGVGSAAIQYVFSSLLGGNQWSTQGRHITTTA